MNRFNFAASSRAYQLMIIVAFPGVPAGAGTRIPGAAGQPRTPRYRPNESAAAPDAKSATVIKSSRSRLPVSDSVVDAKMSQRVREIVASDVAECGHELMKPGLVRCDFVFIGDPDEILLGSGQTSDQQTEKVNDSE